MSYVPRAGDIVWLNFSPQAGHEQAGHRPALVLSPASYNKKRGLMLCCPMTTKIAGYPFEVLIAASDNSAGQAIKSGTRKNVVLSDQVKSVDWRARKARYKGAVSNEEFIEVRTRLAALILESK